MKAAELVVRCLEHEAVEFLFALPGEETLHLTDACNPDFVKLAQSFGAGGMRVTVPSDLWPCLIEACAYDGPVVIDCPVDYSENMKLTERLRALGNA